MPDSEGVLFQLVVDHVGRVRTVFNHAENTLIYLSLCHLKNLLVYALTTRDKGQTDIVQAESRRKANVLLIRPELYEFRLIAILPVERLASALLD